jgi:hypothetical protein
MSNPVKAFERGLSVQRVADRFAMEFPTDEALKKYLKDHPDADRSKHTVKSERSESDDSDYEQPLGSEHQKSEDYKTKRNKRYYPKKPPPGMRLAPIPNQRLRDFAEAMPDEDLDKDKAYNHPAVKKLKKRILADLKSKKLVLAEVERQAGEAHEIMMDMTKKEMAAKTDQDSDPFRFSGRKMFQVWRAYNDALGDFRSK